MGSTYWTKRKPNRDEKNRGVRVRPKTYKNQELAEAAAKRKGLSDYEVKQRNHKYIIVAKAA